MKKNLLLGLFILNLTIAFSQTKTIKYSIYFDTDKFELKNESKKKLDELTDSLKNLKLNRIFIKGNTDNRADSLYNINLSLHRVEAVTNYLVSKNINRSLFTNEHYGEEKPITTNATDDGKQKNRRVDIIVLYTVKKTELIKTDSIPAKIIPAKLNIDTCQRDTILTMKNGTQLVFNRCEYLEKNKCFDIIEIMTSSEAMEQRVSTFDFEENPLASCGMINFKFKANEGCNDNCFKKPVRIRFPVSNNAECNVCGRRQPAQLYDLDKNGRWTPSSTKLKTITINNKAYYQYETKCLAGGNNCDCKIKYRYLKIKTKNKYRILSATVSTDCPLSVYQFSPNNKRKNIIKKKKVPCYIGSGNITAKLLNENGDTVALSNRPLASLQKNIWFAKCRGKSTQNEKKIFGFIPYKKRTLYRKYKIMHKDLIVID